MTLSVLHVITTLDPLAGGTTAALAGLATAQAAAGLNVSILATFDDPDAETLAAALTEAGAKVSMVGPTRGPLRRHPDLEPTLRRLIQTHDIVHVHAVWEEPQHLACRLARQIHRPAILSPHGMLDRWSLKQSRLKKWAYLQWRLRSNLKQLQALHLTTEEERQSVERLGLPAEKIVMPLGLDLHEFEPLPAAGQFRAKHPDVGYGPFVLFLSRLHHKKGIELLLPAFARLQKTHPQHKLVIAGPPDTPAYGQSLRDLADSLGLGDCVVMPGMLRGADRIEAMVDAQVFVLPSYQENFGIVVVEAAAAGLPQVISEHVNLASYVARENIGQVVPLDIPTITDALRRIIDDPDREQVGLRARTTTFDQFGWDRLGPRWEAVYLALCESFKSNVASIK